MPYPSLDREAARKRLEALWAADAEEFEAPRSSVTVTMTATTPQLLREKITANHEVYPALFSSPQSPPQLLPVNHAYACVPALPGKRLYIPPPPPAPSEMVAASLADNDFLFENLYGVKVSGSGGLNEQTKVSELSSQYLNNLLLSPASPNQVASSSSAPVQDAANAFDHQQAFGKVTGALDIMSQAEMNQGSAPGYVGNPAIQLTLKKDKGKGRAVPQSRESVQEVSPTSEIHLSPLETSHLFFEPPDTTPADSMWLANVVANFKERQHTPPPPGSTGSSVTYKTAASDHSEIEDQDSNFWSSVTRSLCERGAILDAYRKGDVPDTASDGGSLYAVDEQMGSFQLNPPSESIASVLGGASISNLPPWPVLTTHAESTRQAFAPLAPPPARFMVQAVRQFRGKDGSELSFDVGDLIITTGSCILDGGWWEGELPNGFRGLFPSNHCIAVVDTQRQPLGAWETSPQATAPGSESSSAVPPLPAEVSDQTRQASSHTSNTREERNLPNTVPAKSGKARSSGPKRTINPDDFLPLGWKVEDGYKYKGGTYRCTHPKCSNRIRAAIKRRQERGENTRIYGVFAAPSTNCPSVFIKRAKEHRAKHIIEDLENSSDHSSSIRSSPSLSRQTSLALSATSSTSLPSSDSDTSDVEMEQDVGEGGPGIPFFDERYQALFDLEVPAPLLGVHDSFAYGSATGNPGPASPPSRDGNLSDETRRWVDSTTGLVYDYRDAPTLLLARECYAESVSSGSTAMGSDRTARSLRSGRIRSNGSGLRDSFVVEDEPPPTSVTVIHHHHYGK